MGKTSLNEKSRNPRYSLRGMNAAIDFATFHFRKSVSEKRRKKYENYHISAQKSDILRFSCVNPRYLWRGITAFQDFL